MPKQALFIDGVDLATLGVTVERDPRGIRDAPSFVWPTKDVPGRIGPLVTATRPKIGPRTLDLTITVEGGTYAGARANARQVAALLDKTRTGTVDVSFVDDQTREYRCRLLSGAGANLRPFFIQPYERYRLRLVAHDPRLYKTTSTVLNVDPGPTDITLGTAPVRPVIRINGAITDPTLTYRDSAAGVVALMDFTITLSAAQWIDIDCEAHTIVDHTAANRIDTLTSGDFFEFSIVDGDFSVPDWPTIERSPSGGAGVTVTYFEADWS